MAISAQTTNLNQLGTMESAWLYLPYDLYGTPRAKRGEQRERRVLTLSETLAVAPLVSYSGHVQEDGTLSACTRQYKDLSKNANVSTATVGRAISKLKEAEYLTKGAEASTYIFDQSKLTSGLFDRLEDWVTRGIFHFEYKDKQGNVLWVEDRRLVPSEKAVFARVYTRCNNQKNKTTTFTASAYDLANALGLDFKTTQQAIRSLRACGLIDYVKKGVNAHQKSVFRLDMNLYRERKRATLKAEKDAAKAVAKATVDSSEKKKVVFVNQSDVDAQKRAERESYYERMKQRAENVAERNEKRALQNPEYKAVEKEYNETNREAAKAEIRNLPTLPGLMAKAEELKQRKLELLKAMGMTLDDFNPKTFAKCRECFDTGVKTDGYFCTCYRKE